MGMPESFKFMNGACLSNIHELIKIKLFVKIEFYSYVNFSTFETMVRWHQLIMNDTKDSCLTWAIQMIYARKCGFTK